MAFGSVSQMIQDILQRAPNPGEAETYQALIDGGSSTLQGIANTLIASQEAANLVFPVLRFYQGVYGRVPDKGGAAYWVDVYRDIAGQDDPATPTQNEALVILARPFVDPLITPEFVSRYGPAPTSYTGPEWQAYATNFIDKLYLNVLQRTADAGGLAYWTGQFLAKFEELRTAYLASGRTEAEAALEARAIYLEQFTNSQEMKDSTAPWINGFLTGAAHDPDPANLYTGSLFNDAPTAVADSYNATEDQMLVVNVGSGVLINDIDPDFAQPLTASVVTGPAVGVLNLASGGSFTYTPPANFDGPVTFTYRTGDTVAQSVPATVTINVAPVNDSPVISVVGNAVFNTLNDRPSLAAWNLTDADGNSQTYTVTLTVDDPAKAAIQGSVGSYDAMNGVYTISGLDLAATNAAIDGLTYVPLAPDSGSVVIGATDSAGGVATNRSMTVNFQNIYSMGATTGFSENEGNSPRLASFTVNRTEGAIGSSIGYILTGGAGFSQSDVGNLIRPGFAPIPMQLNTMFVVGFAVGELSRTVTFEILGDSLVEADETFSVTLTSAPGSAIIQDGAVQGTIFNDDVAAWTVERVSIATDGTEVNQDTFDGDISNDGRYVVIESSASNLVAGDSNGRVDIFLRDRIAGTTTLVTQPPGGGFANDHSQFPTISGDGAVISYRSVTSNLVAGDTNDADIIVTQRSSLSHSIASQSSSGGNAFVGTGGLNALSDSGRYVAYISSGTNHVPGDANGRADAFVYDRQTGTTVLASQTQAGVQGNQVVQRVGISADGNLVVFETVANNFAPGDANFSNDIFVKNIATGALTLVNVNTAGTQSNGGAFAPDISGSGDRVVFHSTSTNLVANDTNGFNDIFVRDIATGTTERVSVATGGEEANAGSQDPKISADGRFVTFTSLATNLDTAPTGGFLNVFIRNLETGQTMMVSKGVGQAQADGHTVAEAISGDGRFVLVSSSATNLVADDTNLRTDLFVIDGANFWWFG